MSEGMTPQGEAYLRWFYDTQVWKDMTWHGVRTLKFPADIWNYQEIIFERRIEHVVETGTRHGGSALFFAETLAARGCEGLVVTIDIDGSSRQVKAHERIRFLIGGSANAQFVAQALSLDSDHRHPHVLAELRVWVPHLRKGDYLIVEDTVVNGHPVRADHGPGPWEAVTDYLAEAPGVLVPDVVREKKFGTTFAARGYFTRA
jgi:cephalosporin hydroxylase